MMLVPKLASFFLASSSVKGFPLQCDSFRFFDSVNLVLGVSPLVIESGAVLGFARNDDKDLLGWHNLVEPASSKYQKKKNQ